MSMVSVRAAELCNRQRRVAGEITEFNKMAVDARRAPRLQQLWRAFVGRICLFFPIKELCVLTSALYQSGNRRKYSAVAALFAVSNERRRWTGDSGGGARSSDIHQFANCMYTAHRPPQFLSLHQTTAAAAAAAVAVRGT